MEIIRRLAIVLVKLVAKILLRVNVSGMERVPASGPVIAVTNHVNFIEPLLLYTLSPREPIGLAKAEIWQNPILRLLAQSWHAIPIRRGELDLNAMRCALQVIKEGRILGLAPEGTRSHHGRLQRGRPGTVLLALRAPHALILPVAAHGQEHFAKNLRRLRRTEVHMVFGQGFYLDPGGARVTHEMRQQMTDEIMMQIAALLPPENRGAYSNLAAATERYLRFPAGARSNLHQAVAVDSPPAPAQADAVANPSVGTGP